MKKDFSPKCLPTGIGSLPYIEAKEACDLVLTALPEIPFWPQLPKRDMKENMYWQYSERLPGVVFEKDRMFIQIPEDFSEIERFYEHFLADDPDFFSISKDYAAGFYQFLEYPQNLKKAWALKGQITGPISFALQVTDEDRRPVLYHEEIKGIAIKNLLAKANWQEKHLKKYNNRVIIFLDEPYLSAFGSAFTSLNREQVIEAFSEVLEGIESITGIHCCGNTDWSLLLETSVDIISFDAYSYSANLLLYEKELKRYLNGGGSIAWGIVPTNEEILQDTSEEILLAKLENTWKELLNRGIDQQQLLLSSLITPTCGLGTVSRDMAARALTMTRHLSQLIREKYKLM